MLLVINLCLCIAALSFPFSVALTNIGLAVVLLLGLVSGLWWQGARFCWSAFRPLMVVFLMYFSMVCLGLLWSHNIDWGMHIMGRHWFWLLIPVIVMSLTEKRWRNYVMLALSVGLSANLVFCVLQFFGYITLTSVAGSSIDNATGHIGHIGFGVVYGIWAAWLLFMGLNAAEKKWMWLYWALSCWAYVMIFAARGRSGYAVAFVLAMAVLIKWYAARVGWKRMLMMIAFACVLLGAVLSFGPASERLKGTWLALSGDTQKTNSFWEDNGRAAINERFQMWKTTLSIYRMHPVLGVGTGGLPDAVVSMEASVGKDKATRPLLHFVHPHNQYLLTLVRWGPMGLLVLLLFLYYWMREGWVGDWHASMSLPLIFLPPLALAIHSLSSSAVEEHFSAILAVLLLGVGLSDKRRAVVEEKRLL